MPKDEASSEFAQVEQLPQIPAPQPFNPDVDEWVVYQEKVEQYMVSQRITAPESRKAVLISLMGTATYKALRDLCRPADVASKSYSQICALLAPQYADPVVVHSARRNFYSASQAPGETATQLLLRLRGLAARCRFGERYDDVLLDRIIQCQTGAIFDRLCEEDEKLTMDKAMRIIVRKEAHLNDQSASQQMHAMSSQVGATSMPRRSVQDRLGVNRGASHRSARDRSSWEQQRNLRLERQRTARNTAGGMREIRDRPAQARAIRNSGASGGTGRPRCIHCGGTNHSKEKCLHRDAECFYCLKKGHIATICPEKQVNFVAERDRCESVYLSSSCDDIDTEVSVNSLIHTNAHSANSPYVINVTVNGIQLEFQIDTGAGITAISEVEFSRSFPGCTLESSTTKLFGYSGERLSHCGTFAAHIELNKKKYKLRIHVIRNGGPPLMGRDLLAKLRFRYSFNTPERITTVRREGVWKLSDNVVDRGARISQQLYTEFPKLFSGTLGTYNARTFKLGLKADAVPKFIKARPVPFAFQKKIDEEIDSLIELNIISPASSTEWGTPVVPIIKPNGKIRLCGDYKTTLNRFLVEVKHPLPRAEDIFATLNGGKLFSKLDLNRGFNQLVLDEESRRIAALSTHRGVF